MSVENRIQQMWLMDWFGCIIEYAPDRQDLIRIGFTPGNYPDTFFLSARPVQAPARVTLRQAASIPEIRDVQFVEAGKGLLALQDIETGNHLSINPRNNDINWNADGVNDWERLIPLTKEMMDGLSILRDHKYGEVRVNGKEVPVLEWPNVAECVGNFAWLGRFAFSITRNLSKLEELGRAAPGETVEVTLVSAYGDVANVVVLRSEEEL